MMAVNGGLAVCAAIGTVAMQKVVSRQVNTIRGIDPGAFGGMKDRMGSGDG
jgi:acyl CoA:acetate/3-ketoacid CoA transferase